MIVLSAWYEALTLDKDSELRPIFIALAATMTPLPAHQRHLDADIEESVDRDGPTGGSDAD